MLSEKDGQQLLLEAIRDRFRAGEGVAGRFFPMENTYLFAGDHKYWLMTHWDELEPGVNYVINRARLYRDRRDFVISRETPASPRTTRSTRPSAHQTRREAPMADESGLLAYLVPRLTSRGEDTATEALAFILNKSKACRQALDNLLSEQNVAIEPITRLKTQVTSDDGSRPDMVGYDRKDHKRLLVESKFWASLLEGQADGYFRQLEASGPAVLMFIAPGTRIETLWAEIRRQLEADPKPVRLESVDTGDRMRRAAVAGSEKRVVLVSWDLLLDRLAAAVPADSQIASDIRQFRGFVEEQDLDAFLPIQREELSPSLARRIRWFNQLIDDVVNRGIEKGWMSVKGLKAAPQWAGYGRYFRFVNDSGARTSYNSFLCVTVDFWATMGDTPLWLWIGWQTECDFQSRGGSSSLTVFEEDGGLWTPIYPEVGVEYHSVLADVVSQLRRIREIAVS